MRANTDLNCFSKILTSSSPTSKLFTSFFHCLQRFRGSNHLYSVYHPDLSGKSHDAHKYLERKMYLGLVAFDLLTSIMLQHIKCGEPTV